MSGSVSVFVQCHIVNQTLVFLSQSVKYTLVLLFLLTKPGSVLKIVRMITIARSHTSAAQMGVATLAHLPHSHRIIRLRMNAPLLPVTSPVYVQRGAILHLVMRDIIVVLMDVVVPLAFLPAI